LLGKLCPECGWRLTAASIFTARQLTSRPVFALFTAVGVLGPLLPLWSLARSLLEVNRLCKVGPTAFIPGYSLLDSTTDWKDAAIVVGAIVVFCVSVTVALRARQAGIHEYRQRLGQLIATLQQSVPPSGTPSSGSSGSTGREGD
jgi:hypothetical protein